MSTACTYDGTYDVVRQLAAAAGVVQHYPLSEMPRPEPLGRDRQHGVFWRVNAHVTRRVVRLLLVGCCSFTRLWLSALSECGLLQARFAAIGDASAFQGAWRCASQALARPAARLRRI
jgi:hypothetical protein